MDFIKKNIHIEDVYYSSYFKLSQKVRLFLRLIRRKPRVDVYHFSFATSPLNSFFVRLIGKNFPCKIQSLPHVRHPMLEKHFNPHLFYGDYVVVNSEFSKNCLEGHGLHKVCHIYPGVDVEKFKPGKKNIALKSNFCAPDDFVILYAGGYGQYEAVEDLFRITARVCEVLEDVRFIFACRLRSRREIKAEKHFKQKVEEIGIDKKISFLNRYENMAELINISDVCMYPFKENAVKTDIPVILLEALAEEKPVIISDMQPMNELFKDAIGFKVEAGDDSSFADKIIEFYNNPDLLIEMGKRGRKVVFEYFNIVNTAKAYEELYEEIKQKYHFD